MPNLKGIPARQAKRLPKLLGCNVNVKHTPRPGVARGAALKTRPGAGTYRFGRRITLVIRK